MTRKHKNWLLSFVKLMEDTESPLQYYVWSAISAISSCLERRCWIKYGMENIYPNQFIVIVGPPGGRKSSGPKIVKRMLKRVNIKYGTDVATKEAILRSILDSETTYNLTTPTGSTKIITQHALTIFSPELQVMLGVNNQELMSWLTDWWDAPLTWEKRTVARDTETVNNLCINLIGLSTPDWLVKSIPLEAHSGGFTSRIIFVVGEGKARLVPWPSYTKAMEQLENELTHDLDDIATNMMGEFDITPDAKTLFTNRYEETNVIRKTQQLDARIAGFIERRHIHMLKIAMALSACETNEQVIETKHIKRSDDLLKDVEKDLDRAFGSVGRFKYVQELEALCEAIKVFGVVQKSVLLRYFSRDIDTRLMDELAKNLEDRRVINRVYDKNVKDWVYEYRQDVIGG